LPCISPSPSRLNTKRPEVPPNRPRSEGTLPRSLFHFSPASAGLLVHAGRIPTVTLRYQGHFLVPLVSAVPVVERFPQSPGPRAICRCASRHAQDRSPCTVTRTTRFASVRADHDRGRVAGQFKSLPGIGDAGAVDLEDGDVLVEVIADQQIFPVGVNAAPSGKPPSSTSSASQRRTASA
jgi:hypothetical protein